MTDDEENHAMVLSLEGWADEKEQLARRAHVRYTREVAAGLDNTFIQADRAAARAGESGDLRSVVRQLRAKFGEEG